MPNVKSLTVNNIKYDIKDATARTAIAADRVVLAGKQDALVAGSNITITGNRISAKDTTYTAGQNITIANGVISATTGGGGSSSLAEILNAIYPPGSLYMGTMETNPIAALMPNSTWRKVAGGKALWISNNTTDANSTINAGLPNITGDFVTRAIANPNGAFSQRAVTSSVAGMGSVSNQAYAIGFDARRVSSIYGNSTTVQPPAYVINVWRRLG